MRTYLLLTSLILLPACGGGNTDEIADASPEVASTSSSNVAPAMREATTAKLPFDIPIMDGARYISGSPVFSKPSKRRGGEAIATIAAKGTPLDVVKYYEKALADNGFEPVLGRNNSESSASVSGERDNGEKFSVTSMRGGSKANGGESQTAMIATKPLPSPAND